MKLSENTYVKLVALVDALAEENPKLDRRIKCAVLQNRGGSIHLKMRGLNLQQLERWFWSMIKPNEQTHCWEWTGTRDENGYGRFKANGKRILAHRAALVYITGDNPSLWALHRCHNPPCSNPFHLYWGTPQNNSRDMWKAERGIILKAEQNPNSKLTWEKVEYLRSGIAPLVDLARHIGINYHYAWKVAHSKHWINH